MQRHLSGVSASVFDVDGTLIDSNPAHAEAWAPLEA
jgi:beta-phosphoglucomutase-like phosphatase (HAD superfamily)